jgi:thiamine-phosphate pyrophosphorylase
LAAKKGVGYIAVGPAFPTTTKENPDPVVGPDLIRKVKKLIGPIPLIAIGGICLENVAQVILAGADAVAVASAVVLAEDPAASVCSLKEAVIRAKAARGKEGLYVGG